MHRQFAGTFDPQEEGVYFFEFIQSGALYQPGPDTLRHKIRAENAPSISLTTVDKVHRL